MANFSQEPGLLNITATKGDDFAFNLDFNIALTGYTFSAKVITISTNTPITITVTNTDLTNGKIALSMAKATLAGLSVDVHKWYLEWTTGGSTRRVLAGDFTVVEYPS